MIPRPFRFAPAVLLATVAALAAPDTPRIRITADLTGPGARVVLASSRPVAVQATRGTGRIEVAYAEPVTVEPAASASNHPALARWRTEGDRTVVFETGPSFTGLETFELRNPSRLVLDLLGAGAAAPAAGPPPAPAPRVAGPVIVLDPGHGGVETGAVGPDGVQEKEVALDLARRLKAALQAKDPSLTVVLTRDEDRLVPLDERTAIANHNRADLFLSIHLNSAPRTSAFGAETYFLAPEATDDEARTLAGLENRAYEAPTGSPPPAAAADRGLELILWDLAQNEYLAESGRLAESIQKELNALAGTRDRGVRQAPFRVLMGATMPAVLVEVGFVSNPEEAARLADPVHRGRIVDALVRAVDGFRQGASRLDGPR